MFEESLDSENSDLQSLPLSTTDLGEKSRITDLITPSSAVTRDSATGANLIEIDSDRLIDNYQSLDNRQILLIDSEYSTIEPGTSEPQLDGIGSNSSLTEVLEKAEQKARDYLDNFAKSADFATQLAKALDNLDNFEIEEARKLISSFTSSDFNAILPIKILAENLPQETNGAFDSLNGIIYLSRDFVVENADNTDAIASVLIEEFGHFLDAKLNPDDSLGDEGAIFAAGVLGADLTELEQRSLFYLLPGEKTVFSLRSSCKLDSWNNTNLDTDRARQKAITAIPKAIETCLKLDSHLFSRKDDFRFYSSRHTS